LATLRCPEEGTRAANLLNADTDANPNPNTDADANPNTDADANPNTDANADANARCSVSS
jgi:hypothetical protein